MVRGFQDLHPADAASGWKDMYVNYAYGMNTDGVDYNPSSAADVVYNPVRAPQCDVNLDTIPGRLSFHGFRNAQVRQGAEKIFMADAMYWWINEWGSGVQPGWKGKISTYDRTGELTHNGTLTTGGNYDTERTVAWRHKKTLANVLFFDGHCEAVRKDRFTTKDAGGNLVPNLKMWRVME
jgi:prepilin-type processing-associated H-X9-DG protein